MIFDHPLVSPALDLGSADPRVRLQGRKSRSRRSYLLPSLWGPSGSIASPPLLYQTLTQFSRGEVGEVPNFEELRWDYLARLTKYRAQEGAVQVLLKGLDDAGVEPLVLKGGDVRHRLYDDPVSRPMGDLDVLIPPADLLKVRGLLKRWGYIIAPRDADRAPGFNARFVWEEAYRSPGLVVDLHWEIRKMGAFYRLPYGPLGPGPWPGTWMARPCWCSARSTSS